MIDAEHKSVDKNRRTYQGQRMGYEIKFYKGDYIERQEGSQRRPGG